MRKEIAYTLRSYKNRSHNEITKGKMAPAKFKVIKTYTEVEHNLAIKDMGDLNDRLQFEKRILKLKTLSGQTNLSYYINYERVGKK